MAVWGNSALRQHCGAGNGWRSRHDFPFAWLTGEAPFPQAPLSKFSKCGPLYAVSAHYPFLTKSLGYPKFLLLPKARGANFLFSGHFRSFLRFPLR